ncbi:hypothetical protein NVP1193O_200 [Vibrio phage 1.193.O._10N.286.52.C6]|nr:hypothetical protein NVP1193O_200 [Vibrio phage 1.193.O._10N.286.52.C6]
MKEFDERCGEFTWCSEGVEKVITFIESKRNYIKRYNMFCERCSLLSDIFPKGLQVTWTDFKKGSFPCLCSKACKLEDSELVKHLNSVTDDNYQILYTNGLKGDKKKVSVYCRTCAEDWELFPSATFEVKVSHLKDGTKPCGCSKAYRYTSYEREVLSRRAFQSKGFELLEMEGKNLKIKNPDTGNVWSMPFSYLSNRDKHLNDPSLRSLKLTKSLEKPDSYHIEEFLKTKAYSTGTLFTRTTKRTKGRNASKYWKVHCGKCKETYYKTLANLKRGQKGCSCAPFGGFDPSKPAHFYIVRWFGYGESYIKFGITNREVMDRISEQNNASAHLDYEILHTFYHESGQLVWDCERLIKSSMQTAVCPKELLPDGYTETIHDTIDNLHTLVYSVDEYLN